MWTENNIINQLGLKYIIEKSNSSNGDRHGTFINLIVIKKAEKLLAEYPYRISDIAKKIGHKHWHRANKLITEIEEKSRALIKFNFINLLRDKFI